MGKITVTAALPYANGPVHIGHVAGVYLPADIYVRYLKLLRKDVIFICGSDEHGVPITIRAKKEGITPQQVVDRYHAIIGESFKRFDISFDIYSRTSNQIHHETAADFFKELYQKGVFIEEVSDQYYDEQAGQFLADRYIVGTCPVCANENAYGDQCEKCGSTLSPSELIQPRSALSGATPVLKPTKNWYLPLDKLQKEFLNEYIENKKHWKSNVIGQCKSWLAEGLKPRAMTRDLDWGIKVPIEGQDGKVLYVWFEAPIGYISATRELLPENWKEYWTGDAQLIHFIGKDNIVFHCIIFPAILHAYGQGFVVPENVPANEFLNLEGNKISTSRNWAVWLNEYLDEFPGKVDELRYVLGTILPETKDSEFTWKDYQTKVNSELVAILGNLVNRVMVLNHKFHQGKLPGGILTGKILEASKAMENDAHVAIAHVVSNIEEYKFRDGLSAAMELARAGNRFLTETEPWKLVKDDAVSAGAVLTKATELCYNIALVLEPFLPNTSKAILKQLNVTVSDDEKFQFWNGKKYVTVSFDQHIIGEASLLFNKIEDDQIAAQIQKLHQAQLVNSEDSAVKKSTEKEVKNMQTEEISNQEIPQIVYDDFAKIHLIAATIVHAEKVEKADKLLKLTLQTSENEKRTVVSGIAMHYAPEEIIGKQVTLVENLAPRKMRGIESQGMILMAEDADGKLVFVSPEKNVSNGSQIS